jgi:hypothetical protein
MIKFNKNFILNDSELATRKTKNYKKKSKEPQLGSLINI